MLKREYESRLMNDRILIIGRIIHSEDLET
jgi:hypothetical protein